jgi:hypothetical protein
MKNIVADRASNPSHETTVPTGKAVPLMTGMVRNEDPVTTRKIQVIRTSEEKNGRAFDFI